MKSQAGLYIHIPYCKNRCSYCDFFKEEAEFVQNEYIDFLLKEAMFYNQDVKIEIDTIYLGGGNTLAYCSQATSKIVQWIKRDFFFF